MTITRIRGGQIQDRTIDGIKIVQGVITNEHLAAGAAVDESKLNIDWAGHGVTILSSKKVVDYIQVNQTSVGGLGIVNVTALNIFGGSTPTPANSDPNLAVEGIIIDTPKNRVALRDSITGDPVLNDQGHEVYGRITHVAASTPSITNEVPAGSVDGVNAIFTLVNSPIVNSSDVVKNNAVTLTRGVDYTIDNTTGVITFTVAPTIGDIITVDYQYTITAKFELTFYTDESGTETPFTMPASQTIDWQYAQRFNLQTINEMFAANEKFVEGTADATAHLNIEQLAKDLYGATFTLDRDGNGNLPTSLKDQIVNEVTRAQLAEAALQTAIDNEAQARADADTLIRNDLASQLVGKGASIIGIYDDANNFITTTVEGALKELADRTTALENNGGVEVTDTHSRDIATTNGLFPIATFSTLEDRIIDIENKTDATKKSLEDADTTIQNALDAYITSNDAALAQEVTDRTNADTAIRNDLASTTNAKGASLIGVEDAANKFTATTVEDVLAEVQGNLDTYKTSNDTALANEVTARTNADTTIQGNLDSYITSNDTRSTAIETKNTEQDDRLTNLETEVQAARGSKASVDERLDVSINEDGTLKAANKIHEHKKYITTIAANSSTVSLPNGETYVLGDGSLSVYVNGILQANGINFTEVAGGTTVDFGSDTLLIGDVVIIEYVKYGV